MAVHSTQHTTNRGKEKRNKELQESNNPELTKRLKRTERGKENTKPGVKGKVSGTEEHRLREQERQDSIPFCDEEGEEKKKEMAFFSLVFCLRNRKSK